MPIRVPKLDPLLSAIADVVHLDSARDRAGIYNVTAMLAYLAWLVGSKSQSPPNSGGLGPKRGPKTGQLGQEGCHFEAQKCQK